MRFKCENNEAIPVGDYVGRFLGVHLQDPTNPNYKPAKGKDGSPLPPGAVWEWEIVDGPLTGRVADRLTGPTCTPKSECTQLAEVLTGKRWADGLEFDLDPAVGTLWRFRVDPREGGNGTRVSLRGLARALDLEKNGHGPPAGGEADPATEGPVIFAKLGGATVAVQCSIAALQRAVKMNTAKLSDPAAFAGEPKWRTVGDVIRDVLGVGTSPAAATA